jgi:hypothetical protein
MGTSKVASENGMGVAAAAAALAAAAAMYFLASASFRS